MNAKRDLREELPGGSHFLRLLRQATIRKVQDQQLGGTVITESGTKYLVTERGWRRIAQK